MALNLFGPPTKDDIKVAYIDPILGLVEGVSICEANEYAKREPGTTFIFRNGNQTLQYLNVNEINQLDPNVLITTDECGGISQKKECGPPTIQIFGGGGIGAAGNPIVGNDGAILAVDIIRGGNGYQYPPLVSARDICNYGSGASFTTVIGEVVETTETFDNEADFEDYELCEPTDVGYGQNWGPDGEDLGSWDPKVYTKPGEDPIKKEVEEFEKIVRRLARAPFWTTRTAKPTKISCSDPIIIPSKYDVTDKTFVDKQIEAGSTNPLRWGDFMNSYAISPVSPSNVRGSDFAGRLFTFEWIEEFPTDGEYIFRGLCDNAAQLYVDNLKVSDIRVFDNPGNSIKKTITKGLHNIRIDLLNIPILETVTTQTSTPSNLSNIQVKKVFNTLDFIGKANRTLWRTNVYGRGGFINEVGVCPFDTSVTLSDNPYAGTHTIIWNNINFPIDGSYRIRMAVDDSVTLFIGDEQIRYEGFIAGTNTPNAEFSVNKFFKAGNYTVRADLEQISGGQFGFSDSRNINPMALAIDIEVTTITETIVSPKSWNENPMGISVTIDAPEPPIPQEPVPEQEGRCPNNPIWTTRFPSIAGYGYNDASGSAEVLNNRYNVPDVFGAENDIPSYKSQGFTDADIRNYLETVYKFIPGKTIGEGMQQLLNDPTWGQPTPGVPLKTIYNLETNIASPISSNFRSSNSSGWFPVRHPAWSKFMNRYAISPVRPLDTPGSDISGAIFTNSWDIDIPYDGFYGVQGTRDNTGKILIDGTEVSKLNGFKKENPDIQKVFITKGRHTIGVEVFNQPVITETVVNQKIFRTKDWQVEAKKVTQTADVDFNIRAQGDFDSTFKIQDLGIILTKPFETSNSQVFSNKVEVGKVYNIEIEVPQSRDGVRLEVKGNTLEMEEERSSSSRDLFCTINKGRFFDVQNGAKKATCKFVVDDNQSGLTGLSGGTSKDGVTYEGPSLFAYKDNRWGTFMNTDSVSPLLPPLNADNPEINGVKTYSWKGVNFPESGQYDITFQADNDASLIINGIKVLSSQGYEGTPQIFKVNITQGKYNVVVECLNVPDRTNIFNNNPTGFALVIRKNVTLRNTQTTPWSQNPVGVSAVLIPPPCPRRIRGKGIVTDVIVNDPGNGYLPPIAPTTTPPSTLALIQTNVPGVPGGGAGGGTGAPGVGVPAVPLSIPSPPSGAPTGINASFRPQFEVVRDPVVIDPQKLLQVTDLVGLKQTGYVNGRAYYGAVYYDKGIRYAGFYETVGEPIQVYDTLRESILAQVITPPSAILRQGTDIRSNDPLLNIPGTVQSTLSSNSIVGAGDIFPPSVPFVQEPVQDPIYPVSLRLKRVLVEDPGINYNVTDQIRIIPSNGAVLEPVFGSFGKIIKVAVIDPGFGFTEYPRIEMFTPL